MTYEVIVSRRAEKSINKLNAYDRGSIHKILRALSIDPRPRGAIKLTNQERYRVKVRHYRVLYKIDDKHLVVTVVEAGHRQGIYKV